MAIQLSGSLAITGSLVATSQIVAQTLNVQQVTSSIVYSSGSNIFGNSLANTQIMTGSVSITGSLSLNGSPVVLTNQTSSTMFVQGGNSFGTQALIGTNDTQNLALETNNSIRMFISSSGNVGIGTTSPLYRLHTQGGSNSGLFLKQGTQIADNPSASFYSGLTFENTSTTNAWSIGYSQGAMFSINYFDTSIYYRYLSITTGGNVGIGTLSPGEKLTINGSLGLQLSGTQTWHIAPSSGNNLEFVRSGIATRMIINSDGDIGIGTTSPVTSLHIVRPTNVGLRLNATAANGSAELDLLSNGTQNAFIDYGPNQLRFRSTNSDMSAIINGSVLVLQNDGNIGIGTTSPASLLTLQSPNNLNDNLITLYNFSNAANSYVAIGSYYGNGNLNVNSQIRFGNENTSGGQSFLAFATGTSTSATERMRITSGGNVLVGIGTGLGNGSNTNPLQVYGGVTIAAQSGVFTYATLQYSGVDFVITGNAHPANLGANNIIFRTGTSGGGGPQEWMRIRSDGYVGIGTTNPLSQFEVEVPAASNTGGIFLDMTGGGGGAVVLGLGSSVGPYIVGNTFPDGTVRGGYGGSRMGFTSDGFSFDYSSTTSGTRSWSTYMRITNGGNVGVGITSPNQKLHVRDGRLEIESAHAGFGQLWIVSSGAGNESSMTFFVNGYNHGGVTPNTNDAWVIGSDGDGASNAFWVYDAGSSLRRMTFLPNGNVGIGTSSPSYRLDVNGPGRFVSNPSSRVLYLLQDGTNSGNIIQFQNQSGVDVWEVVGRNNQFYIYNTNLSNMSLYINPTNNYVGINNTSPGATLDVNGSIYVSGEVSGRSFPFNTLIGAGADATTTTIRAGSTSGFQSAIFLEGGNVSNTIRFNTASAERMRITSIGRVGIGTSSPFGPLHVVGGTTIHNGPQTFSRVQLVFGQTGNYTQVKVVFDKTNWGSVTYDIKLASAGGTYHTAGAYYSNPGFSNDLVSISVGSGISVSKVATSPTGGTQGATWTFSGATMIHPIVTVDIACGNGFQVTPDSITVEFS